MKSKTRLSIKQPQTPELGYDCFRIVMSATLNQNDNMCICRTQTFVVIYTYMLWPTHVCDTEIMASM